MPATGSKTFYDLFPSPLGMLCLIFSGPSLVRIIFLDEEHEKNSHFKIMGEDFRRGESPESFTIQLSDYFRGNLKEFHQDILILTGTEFEKSVWLALREVPYGETRSYRWLAERIGRPKALRAVGRALSKNPIPIVLPCHRIIESDGSIGGYSSGIEKKRRLLNLEYFNKDKA